MDFAVLAFHPLKQVIVGLQPVYDMYVNVVS